MKEKYYIRPIGSGPELPEDFVFGLTYDGSTVTIGGPTVMKDKILIVVRDVFGKNFGVERDHGRRFIAIANRLSSKGWEKGMSELSGRFSITPTRRFRRLMR